MAPCIGIRISNAYTGAPDVIRYGSWRTTDKVSRARHGTMVPSAWGHKVLRAPKMVGPPVHGPVAQGL